MPVIKRTALLSYSAEQIFRLVDDIESYPEFLPYCRAATVHSRTNDEVRASLELAKGSVSKTFTTLNRIQAGKMIEVKLLDGPFRHLNGYWRFDPLSETACKASVDMDFEFSNRLVGLAFGPIFSALMNSLLDSFVARAKQVYG